MLCAACSGVAAVLMLGEPAAVPPAHIGALASCVSARPAPQPPRRSAAPSRPLTLATTAAPSYVRAQHAADPAPFASPMLFLFMSWDLLAGVGATEFVLTHGGRCVAMLLGLCGIFAIALLTATLCSSSGAALLF